VEPECSESLAQQSCWMLERSGWHAVCSRQVQLALAFAAVGIDLEVVGLEERDRMGRMEMDQPGGSLVLVEVGTILEEADHMAFLDILVLEACRDPIELVVGKTVVGIVDAEVLEHLEHLEHLDQLEPVVAEWSVEAGLGEQLVLELAAVELGGSQTIFNVS
jgi:hypothetical protein